MSEGQLPDRVQQLRQRWESDPASRIFLQLAEEYRHLGRPQDALGVLEAGLREHPGYLSALIAKGRCHLELGQPEAARDLLERVVRQDATQMVANKLLVRAYLETGQSARARERLDLYALLHESDPEIEELRSRIRRMEAPRMEASASEAPVPARPVVSPPRPLASPADDLFGLGLPLAPQLPRATAGEDDLFDLSFPAAAAASGPAPSEVSPTASPVLPPTAAIAAGPSPAPTLAAPGPDDGDSGTSMGADLFPGLFSRDSHRRYLEGLGAEGLFPLPAPRRPALPAPVASPPAPALIPSPGPSPGPSPAPSPAPAAVTPAAVEAEELAAPGEEWAPAVSPLAESSSELVFGLASEPAPEPALEWAPPPVASRETVTATLGELYLRQGHTEEAERVFAEVLDRDPENAAAREGLERVRTSSAAPSIPSLAPEPFEPELAEPEPAELGLTKPEFSDSELLAPESLPAAAPLSASAAPADGGSRRQRTILFLNSYLERIRRGSQPDVS